ncbi:MAG: exodeoxyribonuclease VII large subunit, partial [Firmicutes bacterium]|nr:exodeoxyribonuclease VII large subunit [Bacillota bacterium]
MEKNIFSEKRKIFSVRQITGYIRGLIEDDAILNGLWLTGEISNYKRNFSGHSFFTLKDKYSTISCVLFKTADKMLRTELLDGMAVNLFGYISVYEKTGQYQFYVEQAEPVGEGSLNMAFNALKAKLAEEGLFDEDFKRPIPELPNRIAVVTSAAGAVWRDIINVAKRRNPNVRLILIPSSVQGEGAAEEIAAAIKLVSDNMLGDVLIVGRGGGSLEDLWAFNEEIVARAVFASHVPVISAVGHETDFTITDFAADLRAPTPSAAAELAVPMLSELLDDIDSAAAALDSAIFGILAENSDRLERCIKHPALKFPERLLLRREQALKYNMKILGSKLENKLAFSEDRILMQEARLDALSPFAVLKRVKDILTDRRHTRRSVFSYRTTGLEHLSWQESSSGSPL